MTHNNMIWLASYPRSGNTYLRTILRHAFGLKSASVYPDDLGGNPSLEAYVGHIEHGPDMEQQLTDVGITLMKTHEKPSDDQPAIYVIRDARAATVSLWDFYNRNIALDDIIAGNHRFGTWADHVAAWDPWNRPNTLFLKYEDLRDDLRASLEQLSTFLGRDIQSQHIPKRDKIADVDGKWVKKKSGWRAELKGEQLRDCVQINREYMKRAGYL